MNKNQDMHRKTVCVANLALVAHKKLMWIVFLTIFIDMLGVGILLPIFPVIVNPHSSARIIPSNWTHQQAYIMAGWLMSIFSLVQFFVAPLLGQLADCYGRRKVLLLSIIGTALSYMLFAYALIIKNIPLLFIARALDGATGGNIAVAQAIIGDLSPPDKRAKNFGLIGVSIGLGFILGPFIGGKLSDSSITSWFRSDTPFWVSAIFCWLNAFFVFKYLPETLQVKINKRLDITKPLHNLKKAITKDGLRHIIPSIFLFNAGFTFFTTFWGIVLTVKFGFTQGGVGNFFGFTGITIVLAQGLLVRRLSGKVADVKALNISITAMGFCLLGFFLSPYLPLIFIYLFMVILAATSATTRAFSAALITRISPKEELGEAMGINSSAMALAQTFPGIIAGYVAGVYTTLPILIGAIFALAGGMLFRYSVKKL